MDYNDLSKKTPLIPENMFQSLLEKYSTKISGLISNHLYKICESNINLDEEFKKNLSNIVQTSIKECYMQDDQLELRNTTYTEDAEKLPYITLNVGGVVC